MVSIFIFSALYCVVKKKVGLIFLMLTGIAVAYLTVPPVSQTVNSIITLQDSQGSAQLHIMHIDKALSMFKENITGLGFSDEVKLESWILVFGLATGWFGLFFFAIFYIYSAMKMLKRWKFVELIILISFFPIMVIIPFYTFNLPLLLFFIMVFRFTLHEEPHRSEHKLLNCGYPALVS